MFLLRPSRCGEMSPECGQVKSYIYTIHCVLLTKGKTQMLLTRGDPEGELNSIAQRKDAHPNSSLPLPLSHSIALRISPSLALPPSPSGDVSRGVCRGGLGHGGGGGERLQAGLHLLQAEERGGGLGHRGLVLPEQGAEGL